jgi:hypothetical protein
MPFEMQTQKVERKTEAFVLGMTNQELRAWLRRNAPKNAKG